MGLQFAAKADTKDQCGNFKSVSSPIDLPNQLSVRIQKKRCEDKLASHKLGQPLILYYKSIYIVILEPPKNVVCCQFIRLPNRAISNSYKTSSNKPEKPRPKLLTALTTTKRNLPETFSSHYVHDKIVSYYTCIHAVLGYA